jgi:hypothetical protein
MPLAPNQVRHFVNFHDPDMTGHEIGEPDAEFGDRQALSVRTNQLIRELGGDIVWMVGRSGGGPSYFLYGKFEVTGQGESDDESYAYEIAGVGTRLIRPVALDRQAWFQRLLAIEPNPGEGFQVIKEPGIIRGFETIFTNAEREQF